jgi:RNA polymerase sigma-70 factor, ECF subfamily
MRLLGRLAPFASATEVDWEGLYAEELPRIYNFFRYRVGDSVVAEDLTSITFEKAWRSRKRYRRDRAAFTTWLFTIARNVATDHFRRGRQDDSLDAMRRQPAEQTLEHVVDRQDEFARLALLLAQLTERERELLALKYGADLNNRAIARLTGLSESNVGTILHRATTNLRTQWFNE